MAAVTLEGTGLAGWLAADAGSGVRWPVAPFNGPWCAYIALLALAGIGLHFALRHRSMRFKSRTLAAIAGANVVVYTAYTFQAIGNPDLPQVTLGQNLPFHFCNIMAWALILAPLVRWNWLRALCCFPGTLAGVLALTSPVDVYVDRPLFSLAALGFFSVHSVNAILGTLLATLGLFRPSFREAFKSVGYFGLMALAIFPLNLVMRAWVDAGANYFYQFEPENAQILQFFHDLVPVPFIYTLLLAPIAIGGVSIQAGLYALAGRVMGQPVGMTERV